MAKYCFGFSWLDPEAPDFNLVVLTTEKLDVTIWQVPGAVSGLIQLRRRITAEGIMNEFRGCELGTIQISTGYTVTPDVQFSRHTDRNRLKIGVQNIGLRVRNRSRNENATTARLNLAGCRPDGRLRRAVEVPHRGAAFQ